MKKPSYSTPKGKDSLEWVLHTAREARRLEKEGKTEERNSSAFSIFSQMRHVKMNVLGDELEVETWHPRSRRTYVTQFRINGNQQGEADYTYNPTSAAVAHLWKIWALMDHAQNY